MKRRSSRATNATIIQEQQKINKAFRRSAALYGPEPLLEHGVLSDQKCGPVWNIFSRYASLSPRTASHLTEDAVGPLMTADGRLLRRSGRNAELKQNGEEDGDGDEGEGGDATLADPMAPAAAAAAKEAAKSWDADGHHVLDLLQPLLSKGVTAPRQVQEALMHIVLNAEAHKSSSLPQRAYRVLADLLEGHPAAKLEGDVLIINENLWTPIGCPWQAEPHRNKARLQSLREAGGLSALVGSAHNFTVRAAEAACGIALPSAPGVPERGDLGEVMLLRYWVQILKVDFDARMSFMRQYGFRQKRTAILENSLVYRLMQTYTNWADGSNSKPLVVRQLAATMVCGQLAAGNGVDTSANTSAVAAAASTVYPVEETAMGRRIVSPGNADGQQRSGGGGGGSTAVRQQTAPLVSPAEVSAVAATLLGMVYDVYNALDRMRVYVRHGAVGRDNDLVRTDLVLVKAMCKELLYKRFENLQVLLSSLPPHATTRLLVYMVADAAYRRIERGGDQLQEGLRQVSEHYLDNGVGLPPRITASDAFSFLLEEPQQRNAGASNWSWAAGAIRFNDLPHKSGFGLVVTQLAGAALQAAQLEVRWAAAAATHQAARRRGLGAADRVEADGAAAADEDEEEEEWCRVQEWEAEAAAVVELYRRAAKRMQSEGMYGSNTGGDGAAQAVLDRMAVARCCVEQLVRRVETVGLRSGMPLRV